jgi:hypothetical protein
MAKSKIEKLIFVIRNQGIMLDSDLANLYNVETRVLNQAVKRNIERFPKDFMFQLTKKEYENLTSQFVISSSKNDYGGRRALPYAFTELGVAMLSSVLNSERALDINIRIMRTFVAVRKYLLPKSDKEAQIADLRKIVEMYMEKNDRRVDKIMTALSTLIAPPPPPAKKVIGFHSG